MNVLLTFTGFHDPFNAPNNDGEASAGPVLTVLASNSYDVVYLFTTSKTEERGKLTEDAIRSKYPNIQIQQVPLLIKDPTNHLGILRQLRKEFSQLKAKHEAAKYSISISSGTPHMHACWLLLTASGEIPATLLQAQRPEHVPPGKCPVKKIDLTPKDFPQISPNITAEAEDSDEELIFQTTAELKIVGQSPAFQQTLFEAFTLAQFGQHLLLLGETGTGKEKITEFIHQLSQRANKPLTTVNCGSIPENLEESVLFGHTKGSFTGATDSRDGKFKAADGGILFLDELGELPLSTQAKLLRALELVEVEPVGAKKPITVNVQVIGATNKNIKEMVEQGTFREDLYQRFISSVEIPSLRQRRDDIPLIAKFLLDDWNNKQKRVRKFTPEAIHALCAYDWPGNVRELRNTIVNSAMFSRSETIDTKDIKFQKSISSSDHKIPEPEPGFSINEYVDTVKEQLVDRALEKTSSQAEAARILNWTPSAMSNYLSRKKTQL